MKEFFKLAVQMVALFLLFLAWVWLVGVAFSWGGALWH